MKKIAIFLKQQNIHEENSEAERQLRRKIVLLNIFKKTLNTQKRELLIDGYKKVFPKDVDTIDFLKEFNSTNHYGVQKLMDWIEGMQIEADRIKVNKS